MTGPPGLSQTLAYPAAVLSGGSRWITALSYGTQGQTAVGRCRNERWQIPVDQSFVVPI